MAVGQGGFSQPAEIEIFNSAVSRGTVKRPIAPRRILTSPALAQSANRVIVKPPGSYSATIALDTLSGLFYVTDSGNGQVKSFALADVLNAYNNSLELDWNTDSTPIGTPFQFPLGGVSGFTAAGNLVIGGFDSIVEVIPGSATTVKTLDPAGTSPLYKIIYNQSAEGLIAIQSDYPNSDIIHTTQMAVPMPIDSLWIMLVMLIVSTLDLVRKKKSITP